MYYRRNLLVFLPACVALGPLAYDERRPYCRPGQQPNNAGASRSVLAGRRVGIAAAAQELRRHGLIERERGEVFVVNPPRA